MQLVVGRGPFSVGSVPYNALFSRVGGQTYDGAEPVSGRDPRSSGGEPTDAAEAFELEIPAIVGEELALLDAVCASLEEPDEGEDPVVASITRDLERLREQILSRTESKDAVALNDQWHRQSALLRQLRASRDAPRVDRSSPYFAHLRLREGQAERDLCLGRATCIQRGVRIVDWRNAPVSRIFYRYEQGEEYEEEFAGRARSGEVLARRTVAIRGGTLERVEAPEGVFVSADASPGGWEHLVGDAPRLAGGEGSALRAHAAPALGVHATGFRHRADKRLPEITSLIDPSQFDLITRPAAGFLLIRGSAGSGKTTVALHRIAYLAYDEPEIDSQRTLFVAFSPALRRYVDHVLPALGLHRVGIRTFQDWAGEQLRRHFPGLPSGVRINTPTSVRWLKLHPLLGAALAERVQRTPGPASAAQALDDWASTLTDKGLLQETADRLARGVFNPEEIGRFAAWNRRHNEDLFQWLAGDRDVDAELDEEDVALLLRAWQLRVGPLRAGRGRALRYRHIAVDEVQEFSPLEVQVLLGCLDRHRSITLAGDTQQRLIREGGSGTWSEFLGHLGVPGTEIETLRVGYRSTREIMRFALGVLGDLREDESAPESPRAGPPVETFRFTDRGACVAFLADALRKLADAEPLASVALLTPSAEASAIYHDGLAASEVPRLRRVANQDFTFGPGIEVTEIDQVKGLEFDYVVLVDVTDQNFPERAGARRLLHVGASRAVHQLWITSVGTPCSLLRDGGVG